AGVADALQLHRGVPVRREQGRELTVRSAASRQPRSRDGGPEIGGLLEGFARSVNEDACPRDVAVHAVNLAGGSMSSRTVTVCRTLTTASPVSMTLAGQAFERPGISAWGAYGGRLRVIYHAGSSGNSYRNPPQSSF